MPQLDRLLDMLAAKNGTALRLGDDEHARLVRGGVEHPITRAPLTAPHVLTMLREVAPPHAAAALESGNTAQFDYPTSNTTYRVQVRRDGSRLTAEVTFAVAPGEGLSVSGSDAGDSPPAIVAALDSGVARAAMEGLLQLQLDRNASDLHLRSGARPVMRVHGNIESLDDQDPLNSETLEAMVASIMPERNQREYAKLNDSDFAYELPGLARFRGNVFRDRHGAGAVFRSIPSRIVAADELGLSAEVQALASLSKGLVLVTGPTGSGKSTTLAALVDLVNRTRKDHIITIEDPIEFVHESKGCLVTQRQVGAHTQSFKQALRAALREDPDIVMVGELRDLETVAIAIETAETGHLVFGTLHTSTAASTIDRIIDQFPADRQEQVRVMLSESLRGVISQTLCRKVGGGRVAAMEILLATPALSNLIREAKTFQIPSVMQTSKRLGMVTLNDALLHLVERTAVEPREAWLKSVDKSGLAAALKARGFDTGFADGAEPPNASSGVRANGPANGAPQRSASPVRR